VTTPGVKYSEASRCEPCGQRALLAKEAADALVVESLGRLAAFPCPLGEGWHVWAPDIETGTAGRLLPPSSD
jgi:hypothetical protein